MARLSVFLLLLVLVFGALSANPNECLTSDPSPCSGNGKCVQVDTEAFCSCYSGYSDIQCAQEPPSDFVAAKVISSISAFAPLVDFTLDSSVTVIVLVPSEESAKTATGNTSYSTQTTIRFSTTASTSCDYPKSSKWATSTIFLTVNGTSAWYDYYNAVFDYTQLVECGLTKKDVSTRQNYIEYSSQVHVKRDYVQHDPNGSGLTLQASNSISKDMNFFFPTKVNAQTTINLLDNSVATFTAVTAFGYNVTTDLWTFTLGATVSPNYELKLSGNPIISQSSRTVSVGSLTTCDAFANTENCKQTFDVTALSCSSISFVGELHFTIVCRSNNPNCVEPATKSVNPTIHITSASACPISAELKFTGVSMNSFSDSALSTPFQNFGTSHTVFFAVGFNSLATVAGVSVENICVRPYSAVATFGTCGSNVGDVLFPHSDVAVGSTGFKYAFSLNGNDFKSKFSVTRAAATRFTVQADLVVDTNGLGQKRSIVYQNAQFATVVSMVDDSDERQVIAANRSSASSLIAGAAFILAAALLF